MSILVLLLLLGWGLLSGENAGWDVGSVGQMLADLQFASRDWIQYDPSLLAQQAWLPPLVVAVVAFFVLSFFNSRQLVGRVIITTLLTYLGVRYYTWRLMFTLNLSDPANTTASILFFLAELILGFYTIVAIYMLQTKLTDRKPQADQHQQQADATGYHPTVDIFIASYNEPEDLLRRTILGCQAVNYDNKQIHLLDDGRRAHVRALCQELGTHYHDRPDNKHYKAGNLNNALGKTDGELIVFLDADFVPHDNFISRVRGFFMDPEVALVQTPQHFNNSDAVAYNLGMIGRLTNEQDIFFRNGQPSRDTANAVICHGTCFMARRSELLAMGGIPTETLSEDFLTSLKLQIRGKKVLYLNEVLSAGFVPEDVGGYVTQRVRWARGTIQVLFSSLNPLTAPTLNWMQKVHHFMGFFYWISFIAICMLFLTPLLFLFFDLQPVQADMDGILFYMVPFFLGSIVFTNRMNNGRRSFFWSTVYDLIIAFPTAMTVIMSLYKPFGTPFKVTPKDVTTESLSFNSAVAAPLVTVLVLYALGLLYKIFFQNALAGADTAFLMNLFWCAYNATMLWLAVLACFDAPQRRAHVRFRLDHACRLAIAHEEQTKGLPPAVEASLINLSESGALLMVSQVDGRKLTGSTLRISLPEVGLVDLPARVVSIQPPDAATAQQVSLQFEFETIAQQRQLISYLFGQSSQKREVVQPEYRYFLQFFKSLFQVHPLTNN